MKLPIILSLAILASACGVEHSKTNYALPKLPQQVSAPATLWCAPKKDVLGWVMNRLTQTATGFTHVDKIRVRGKKELLTSTHEMKVKVDDIALGDYEPGKHAEDEAVPADFKRKSAPEKVLKLTTDREVEVYLPCSSFSDAIQAAEANESSENFFVERSFSRAKLHKAHKNDQVYGAVAFPVTRVLGASATGNTWCSIEKNNDYIVSMYNFKETSLFTSKFLLPLGLATRALTAEELLKTFDQADRFLSNYKEEDLSYSVFEDANKKTFMMRHAGITVGKTLNHEDIFYDCGELFKPKSYFGFSPVNRKSFRTLVKKELGLIEAKPSTYLELAK